MSAARKLDKILFTFRPPKSLSDQERATIKEAFKQMGEVLDAYCEDVLKMDRDTAAQSVESLLGAIRGTIAPAAQKTPIAKAKSGKWPDIEALIKQLPLDLQAKARSLECYKNFLATDSLKDAICPKCSIEELQGCINTYDESIKATGDGTKVE